MSEPLTHLIWSEKWGRWHQADQNGRPSGYCQYVEDAGLFPASVALSYGAEPTINRAFTAAEGAEHLRMRLTEINLKREVLLAALARMEAAA